ALFTNKAALVKTLPCLLFTFVVATLWVTLHDASFMQEIVNYPWPATSSLSQGIINTLTLSYRNVVSQIPLSICLLLGVLYTIIRKKHLWLTAAYIITCIICLNATTSDGVLKSYLSGFWYTDSVRLAANAAILGIPLAALGFSKLLLISDRLLKVCVQNINRNINIFCTGVLLVAFIGVNYYPSFTLYGFADITTAFGDVEDQLTAANNLKYKFDQVLSNSELEFLKQVRDVIPDDALIYNCPDDGSTFAYPIFDLNVYYRRTGYEASNSDGEISATLRTDFVNYSVDNHVQQSVEESGVQYVLLLDIGDDGDDPDGERYFYNHYNSSSWDGLYDIDDSTPGFETVLAEDDMRLYKVL
ncbi:MAG TPA: hypothetical protein IAD14_02410, partial [Candidatus Coprousia avicola]|nr:hypothetical protein [Candidatus Coprousia avicola]